MSCLMLRVWTHLFCCYFQCHLSYHQQFVWYPGYHGYQFCAPLLGPVTTLEILQSQLCAQGTGATDSCTGDSGGPIMARVRKT